MNMLKKKGLRRPAWTFELEIWTSNCSSLVAHLKVQLSATQVVTHRTELVLISQIWGSIVLKLAAKIYINNYILNIEKLILQAYANYNISWHTFNMIQLKNIGTISILWLPCHCWWLYSCGWTNWVSQMHRAALANMVNSSKSFCNWNFDFHMHSNILEIDFK